jgi:RNA polymerase sigma-70 factor, ECF subfamily
MTGQPSVALAIGGIPVDDPSEHLAALFDAHEERLYRLARRLAANADEANDLVQETFLRAAKSVSAVPRGIGNEEAWLVRVLVNIQRDQWRKTAVRARSLAMLREDDASGGSSAENALIAKRAVWAALDLLPPRRRAIVVMHELEGMSVPAIAAVLGLRAMTVRWHLSMGRRDLRRALEPHMRGIA